MTVKNEYGSAVLNEMLEPVSRSLGVKTARALVALRMGHLAQARVEKLAERCGEGKLTARERSEYEAYVQASTLIGILQAKARRVLAKAN
jgi:hypothetical protein